jgi:hypothetical protein
MAIKCVAGTGCLPQAFNEVILCPSAREASAGRPNFKRAFWIGARSVSASSVSRDRVSSVAAEPLSRDGAMGRRDNKTKEQLVKPLPSCRTSWRRQPVLGSGSLSVLGQWDILHGRVDKPWPRAGSSRSHQRITTGNYSLILPLLGTRGRISRGHKLPNKAQIFPRKPARQAKYGRHMQCNAIGVTESEPSALLRVPR